MRLPAAVLTVLLTCGTVFAQVSVTATSGMAGLTSYTTLKAAFDAVNAGAHQGVIDIRISADTTETAMASLNASGSGGASYSSVFIAPEGGPRTIQGAIFGAVIKLNGADHVTIDGRIGGLGRNLTVVNTLPTGATAGIWLSSVDPNQGATSNLIRNLEIATGTFSSSSVGIIMSGPQLSLTSDGHDNDNNSFIANRIVRAGYGILTRGSPTNPNLNIGTVVTENIIGPSAFGSDQIGGIGIFMQSDTGASIARNTVQFVGCLINQTCPSPATMGIAVGGQGWSLQTGAPTLISDNYTIKGNLIHDIVNENTDSAVGLNLAAASAGSATSNMVVNNMIYNVRSNGTSGRQVVGLLVAGGHTDTVAFNSIALTGEVDPSPFLNASTTFGNAIRIAVSSGTTHANLKLFGNSVYLDASSVKTPSLRFYAITGVSSTYSFGSGGEDFNNYYINSANPQLRTGGFGPGSAQAATTEFPTLADWKTAYVTPQDANSIQANPLYASNTSDLHIDGTSPNRNTGPANGVGDDIDGEPRSADLLDIGADEIRDAPGSVQFSSAFYRVGETAGLVTITVTRTAGAAATHVDYATVAGGSAVGGINCAAGVDYISTSGSLAWTSLEISPKTFTISICSETALEGTKTIQLALSSPTAASLGTPATAVVGVVDSASFGGFIEVGAGKLFQSLTNSDGLFEALNAGTVTGNVTILITSNLTSETGTFALNQFAPEFSLVIKPSGGSRTVSGITPGALIKLNGADNVTIDGRIDGAGRNLAVRNASTATDTAAIWLSSLGVGQGASNNTIRNLEILAGTDATNSNNISFGILMSGNSLGISSDGNDNDNNSFIANRVVRATYGIVTRGSGTNYNLSPVVADNIIGPTTFGSDQIGRVGILMQADTGATVSRNIVQFVSSFLGDMMGIAIGSEGWIAGGPPSTFPGNTYAVTGNVIHDVVNEFASDAVGLNLSTMGLGVATNNVVSNNIIYNVRAVASGQTVGLGIGGGHTDTVVFNSIALTGNVANITYGSAIRINVASSASHANLTLKNNSVYLDTTAIDPDLRFYAITAPSASYSFGTGGEDYNNYYVNPANPRLFTGGLGTNMGQATSNSFATLDAWRAAYSTPQDLHSIQSDPLYSAITGDLHIGANSPNSNAGTSIAGVSGDIDSDPRPATPDIGADELVQSVGGVLPSGTFYNVSGDEGDALAGNVMVTGTLTLGGRLNTGGGTLTIACGGSVSGAGFSSYVVGNLAHTFCSTGSKTFDVGTANGYSPVTVTATAGVFPADFTVRATQGPLPGFVSDVLLQRYWTTSAAGVTADLTFQYLPTDVSGTESNYKVIGDAGGSAAIFPAGTVDPLLHKATVNGVNTFGNWSLGEALTVVTRRRGQITSQ